MAKKKSSGEAKKNITFTLAAGFLIIAVAASVVLFIVSALLHGKTSGEFTKSMYPVKYEYYVESSAKEFGVDVCLIYGVIRTESGFDPDAVSQAGAIGLMQIMPETFTWLQNYRTEFMPEKILDSDELYKPQVNIEYGTYLLRFLLDHYNGDTSLVIIAYNAGYGNVDNWIADGTIPKSGVTSADVPFTETANYLDRVSEAMEMYRTLYYADLDEYSTDAAVQYGTDEGSDSSDDILEDTDEPQEQYTDADAYIDEYTDEDGGEYGYAEDYGYGEEDYGY